jgi:hypothetical protein
MTFNTCGGLNHAINDNAGQFTGQNEVGIFAKEFDTLCPYTGKKRNVCFYYRHLGDGKPLSDPVHASDIAKKLANNNHLQRDCIQVGSIMVNTSATNTADDAKAKHNNNTPKRAHKYNHHGATHEITPARDDPSKHVGDGEGVGSGVEGDSGVCSQSGSDDGCYIPPYQDSPEAGKLFGFSYKQGEDVFKELAEVVKLLYHVQQSYYGYRLFVADVDHETLTPKQMFHI